MHYHVRQLLATGFLEQAAVRTGEHGALEKPYRSTGLSWWLSSPLPEGDPDASPDEPFPSLAAFEEELRESGPDSVRNFTRFVLHLSPEDIEELDRRILAVLDEYIKTDGQRLDQPAHGGIVVVHRLAE